MLNVSSVYNEFVFFSSLRLTLFRSNITSTLGTAKVGGLNLTGHVFFASGKYSGSKKLSADDLFIENFWLNFFWAHFLSIYRLICIFFTLFPSEI